MRSIKSHQLYQLFKTQFLLTIREPAVLFWGMIFPVLISIGLGLAFTQQPESKFNIVRVEKNKTELDSLLNIFGAISENKGESIQRWKVSNKTLGNVVFRLSKSDWKDRKS